MFISQHDIDFHKLLWTTMAQNICLEEQTGLIDKVDHEKYWIARETGTRYVNASIFCTAVEQYFDKSFRRGFCDYCPALWHMISPYDRCFLPYRTPRSRIFTLHEAHIYTKYVTLVENYQKLKDKTSKTALQRKDWARKLAILIRDVPLVAADRLPWSERKQLATKFY